VAVRPSMLWPVFVALKAMVSSRARASPPNTSTVIQAAVAGLRAGAASSAAASSSFAASIAWATARTLPLVLWFSPYRIGRQMAKERSLSLPVRTVRRVLLPATCPGCGAQGPALCSRCAAALAPPPGLPPPAGVDACVALLAYDGPGRRLVARLKYRNERAALGRLAAALAAAAPAGAHVVTWVPTTPARRRQRGFDQAELLARRIARRLHRPCRRLLDRRPGPPQTGRSRAERRRAPPAFAARRPVAGTVLLVDDVVTTGASASAAARALRNAGAARVVLLTAARTPPPWTVRV
jgi:predicted amidophosphoribosyltransferase